jgi:metal-sulfur cluster biosynthetic enzyme
MPEFRRQDHTDSVETKLRLLEAACKAGDRDLALSLAESLRDTLDFERGQARDATPGYISSDRSVRVETLPRAWAEWAGGWAYVRAIALYETVNLGRTNEPVEARLEFHPAQITDPYRELRVARIEPMTSLLREVPSQVTHAVRTGDVWQCRVLFIADVPAHGEAGYLVFHGNPLAELPEYVTDLRARGEGHDLTISNHYYHAKLSRQMGQLERLTYRREHGLELYAGGKGHGEPPGIDWAHDYVDLGQFQKLRIKNWARCPNFEVETGPLLIRCRRWGFPHSPLHPVFAPGRVHVDQAYSFLAGHPYFLKEGRMDAVQDVTVEAMRDDEWVFSGYSFTDTLWVDRFGKLREGPVPPEEADRLRGVGFRHKDSRDAFLALWLEHRAKGRDSVGDNGSPTLHYPGHGQLWSRYPLHHAELKAGTSIRQRNAYLVFDFDAAAGPRVEALRQGLLHPVEVRPGEVPKPAKAAREGSLARPGETADTAPLKPAIWRALAEVTDDQLYTLKSGIVDLGYVYDVRVRQGIVHVIVTMPHRGRPVHDFLVTRGGGRVNEGIRERVLRVDGVRDVVVDLTWDPPWTASRLSDAARRELGLAGRE